MKDITATEIEERYKSVKPLSDPLAEIAIDRLAKLMEEIASMPRETHIRQPGEKCAYEVYNEKKEIS